MHRLSFKHGPFVSQELPSAHLASSSSSSGNSKHRSLSHVPLRRRKGDGAASIARARGSSAEESSFVWSRSELPPPQGRSSSSPPFASSSQASMISASYSISQPATRMFQAWAQRARLPSIPGPVSFLLAIFALFMTLLLMVRSAIIKRVKSCKCCKGFGILRCQLCQGTGSIGWKAKLSYSEGCPLCMTKRFINCPDCGGYHHRHMFNHLGGKGVGFTNG